jgi:hypothetical protein
MFGCNSRWRPVSAVIVIVTQAACTSYQLRPSDSIAPTSVVRLRFGEPRELVFAAASGDSTLLSNIGEIEGQVSARNGDTLTVVVSRARQAGVDARGALDGVIGQTSTRLVLGQSMELRTKETDWGGTLLVVGGILAVLGGIAPQPGPNVK